MVAFWLIFNKGNPVGSFSICLSNPTYNMRKGSPKLQFCNSQRVYYVFVKGNSSVVVNERIVNWVFLYFKSKKRGESEKKCYYGKTLPKSVTSQDQRYQSYKVLKSGNNFIEKTEKSLSKKKKKKKAGKWKNHYKLKTNTVDFEFGNGDRYNKYSNPEVTKPYGWW